MQYVELVDNQQGQNIPGDNRQTEFWAMLRMGDGGQVLWSTRGFGKTFVTPERRSLLGLLSFEEQSLMGERLDRLHWNPPCSGLQVPAAELLHSRGLTMPMDTPSKRGFGPVGVAGDPGCR